MIPQYLCFEAFGPYVARQTVNFAPLRQAGLVLIHGETGAGKTALLDAMTYALYGRSSGGGRGELGAMRCLLAPAGTATWVEYEFQIGGHRYRFTRSLRLKRGKAESFAQEQNCFFQGEDGDWAPFFENPTLSRVNGKAQELIGLTYDQFRQVMILPQGQFERLLTSRSEEKEEILMTLFHAQKWQQIAEILCQRANARQAQLRQERGEIQSLLAGCGCQDQESLGALLAQQSQVLEEETASRQALAKELEAQRTLLAGEIQLEKLLDQLEAARREQAELAAREPELAALARRESLGRAAAKGEPLYRGWEEAARLEQRRRGELVVAEQKLERDTGAARQAEEAYLAVAGEQEAREQDKIRLAALEALVADYGAVEQAKGQAQAAQQRAAAQRLQWERGQQALEQARQEAAELAARREQIFADWSSRLPQLEDRCRLLAQAQGLQGDRARLEQELTSAKAQEAEIAAKVEQVARLLEETRARHSRLSRLYLEDAAAVLAQALEEGSPCPVCGGLHHPSPARSPGEAVGREQVEAMAKRAEEVEASLGRGQQRLQEARVALGAKEAKAEQIRRLLETLPPWSKQAQEEASAQLAQAKAQDTKRLELTRRLGELEQLQERLTGEGGQALQALEAATQDKEAAGARYQALLARLDPAIPDSQALAGLIQGLGEQVRDFADRLARAQERRSSAALGRESATAAHAHSQAEHQAAKAALEQARQGLGQGLGELGFGDEESFLAALLPAGELEQIQGQLEEARTRQRVLAARLEELGAAEGSPRPDTQGRQGQVARLEEQRAALDEQIGALGLRIRQLEQTAGEVEVRTKALEGRLGEIDKLSAFAKGLRGDSGISLRRYVLGVMLSSVTAEANRLLRTVHEGRYQLYRTLEGVGREKKVGLELEVLDGYSGRRRGVASLSGGEKFLVSLALALGLAAVAQAQSGGVRMDAMFIDEGFGSLDPASIQDALGVLAAVTGSRRLVGIISHVEALRESIPASIQVHKGRDGSRLEVHLE